MEQVRTENKMGTMPIGKLLANMAIPMMVSMLVQAFYNVVDSVYVSQLNENALSAISLAFPLQNLMIAFGSGTAVGTNALLSRALGAKRHDLVDRAANTSIFLMFCNFAVFCVLGLTLSRSFFLAQTDVSQIVEYGTSYTSICLGASIGIFAQFCFERLLQSTGRTKLAMYTQITGAVINIILDPILIFGWLGFPRMEVAGAALATVIGQIVAAILAIWMNLKYNPDVRIRPSHIRFHWDTVKEIYRVGIPSIVMMSISSVMNFGLNQILIAFSTTATAVFGVYFKLQSFIFMPVFGLNNGMVPIISYNYGARKPERVKKTIPSIVMMSISSVMNFGLNQILIAFSTTATAVFGVYFKLQSFIFMPVFGLNNGMVPIISYNYGARKPERVKKTIRLSITAAICLMLIGLALFELIPGTLLTLFNATGRMRKIGIPAFRIIAIHFLFAGFCIVSGSVFQAIGNPLHALINSVCRQLVVLLPAAWLLAQTGKLEMVWFCFPIAEIFSFTLSAIFLRKTLQAAHARMLADDAD